MASFTTILFITQVVILVIGVFGNILSFIVFSRRTFIKNSISTYCKALAIFDLLTNYQLAVEIGIFFNVYLPYISNGLCKAYFYCSAVFTTIPGWILVMFSLDKALSLRRNKVALLKKKWFQWLTVVVLALVNMLIYVEIPIDIELKLFSPYIPNIYYCDWSTLSYFKVIIIFYLFESGLVPFLIMMASSIATIYLICKSRKSVERIGRVDKMRRSRDIKFAISSLTFNLLYVVLKVPLVVLYILYAYNVSFDDTFATVAAFLFYLNSAASFFIHLTSNSLFRRELLILMRIRKANRIETELSHSISTRAATYPRQRQQSIVEID